MLKAKEIKEENPICPFCESELTTILFKQIETTFGKKYAHFCEHCKKVLGITHRKGFWMG
ncbi:MAG: hypothetical protein U5K00_23170 [Melioribacteraceae bacterium]|nr:hypothetical protein [Melioribacteraceae bacterium]